MIPPITPTSRSRERLVYTYLTGQYDNLGDALLRRAMLHEMSGLGSWRVYLGNAPTDYEEALHLPEGTRIYRSPARWFFAGATSLIRHRRAVLVSNPGEISSTPLEFVLGTIVSMLALCARIGRNPSLRLGVGARDRRRPLSLAHELATQLATISVWRDGESQRMYRKGSVAPDWAFALEPFAFSGSDPAKRLVVLSYRGDKPRPHADALGAIKAWCDLRGYDLKVATQVRSDAAANQELADLLGVEHLLPAQTTLGDMEIVARGAYSRAAVVLSNRIHVLIAAAIDGAAPGAVLAHPDVKIERTLTVGHLSTHPISDKAAASTLVSYLDELLLASARDGRGLDTARGELRRMTAHVFERVGEGEHIA